MIEESTRLDGSVDVRLLQNYIFDAYARVKNDVSDTDLGDHYAMGYRSAMKDLNDWLYWVPKKN